MSNTIEVPAPLERSVANVLERFARSPLALARLLEAAGPLALERAGRILREQVQAMDERVDEGEEEGAEPEQVS